MLEILPRLPGTESHNKPVTLLFDDKQVLIRGRNHGRDAWTTIPVPGVAILGKSVEVCLNRTYQAKALRMGLSEIELNAEIGVPLVCRSTGKMMIIMPLRPDEPPATPPPVDQPQTAQPEPAAESKPSDPQPPPTTENIQERNTTSMTQTPAATVARTTVAMTTKTNEAEEKSSALKAVLEHIEKIKRGPSRGHWPVE